MEIRLNGSQVWFHAEAAESDAEFAENSATSLFNVSIAPDKLPEIRFVRRFIVFDAVDRVLHDL